MRQKLPWLILVALVLMAAEYPRSRSNFTLLLTTPNAATYIDKSINLRMNRGATISRIDCTTSSSTQGVNVVSKTDPSQAGTNVCSADMTATTTSVACASISDPGVAAGEWISLDVEGATASVALSCTVSGSY